MQTTAINHQAESLTAPKAADATSGSGSGNSSSGDSTTITANDFLTLLVAEMKNQDPTSDQDPNAYIDQLVQVNSLQQLIQINQDLGTPSTNTSAPTSQVSAIGAAGATTRAANTASAVSAAQERLKASDSTDAASRLETALAPKNTNETPSFWGGSSQSDAPKAASF